MFLSHAGCFIIIPGKRLRVWTGRTRSENMEAARLMPLLILGSGFRVQVLKAVVLPRELCPYQTAAGEAMIPPHGAHSLAMHKELRVGSVFRISYSHRVQVPNN